MTWAQVAAINLLQGIQGRLQPGSPFADVLIQVGETEFPCHRVILAAYSDYFLAMFTSGMQEDVTRTVKLNDVPQQVRTNLMGKKCCLVYVVGHHSGLITVRLK